MQRVKKKFLSLKIALILKFSCYSYKHIGKITTIKSALPIKCLHLGKTHIPNQQNAYQRMNGLSKISFLWLSGHLVSYLHANQLSLGSAEYATLCQALLYSLTVECHIRNTICKAKV